METSTSTNIADVIKNYKLLLKFLDPILACWRAAVYVFSWKNEILSIGVLLSCILIVYNVETVLFSSCLVGIVCLLLSRQALIMQRPIVQQPNLKESLKYIHPNNPYLGELLEAEKQVEKTIKEYRHMLLQVNKLISQANETIDLFYRILRWELPLYSASLLFALCVLCLLSVFVSMRVLLVILTLYVFCANKGFLEWVQLWCSKCWQWLLQYKIVSRVFKQQQPVEQQLPQQPPLYDSSEQVNAETSVKQDTLEVQPSQDQATSENEEENNSKHVGKKPERKKRRQENVASCEKCGVSFAKLLKRKHQCNYCGAVCCGSCTVKVKKFLLGATSPTAYSEVVRVCGDCNDQLEQMQLELNKFQSSVYNSSVQ